MNKLGEWTYQSRTNALCVSSSCDPTKHLIESYNKGLQKVILRFQLALINEVEEVKDLREQERRLRLTPSSPSRWEEVTDDECVEALIANNFANKFFYITALFVRFQCSQRHVIVVFVPCIAQLPPNRSQFILTPIAETDEENVGSYVRIDLSAGKSIRG